MLTELSIIQYDWGEMRTVHVCVPCNHWSDKITYDIYYVAERQDLLILLILLRLSVCLSVSKTHWPILLKFAMRVSLVKGKNSFEFQLPRSNSNVKGQGRNSSTYSQCKFECHKSSRQVDIKPLISDQIAPVHSNWDYVYIIFIIYLLGEMNFL